MSDEQPSLFLQSIVDEPARRREAPADQRARETAVDTRRSVLVQAPAGAGKTELLTGRMLALLAEVDEPEDILAITFTRAATAEMRSRVLSALKKAEAGEEAPPAAHTALAHARQRGWRLLEQPHRLDIQTIDSLCLRLAHAQPLLARLGGRLQPAENDDALYARAAQRTVAALGMGDAELDDALETLLLRRDNNIADLERLLAAMLRDRGAWLGVLPLAALDDTSWAAVRTTLEAPLRAEHERVLAGLASAFAQHSELEELLALARYAGGHLPGDTWLRGMDTLPTAVPGWLVLAGMLLTGKNEWRKSWDKHSGFPAKTTGPDAGPWKQRMEECCIRMQATPGAQRLLQLLCALRNLPPIAYSDAQWAAVQSVFRILRRAAAELRVVFAETGRVDFTEIAQAAEAVLRDEGSLRGMLESERKRHLLIDEFQDTSRSQHRLVAELLREWAEGDGRTVFLVGDPLQSIYLFRQAEVALFHETREHGLRCGDDRRHGCEPLTLTHNFRSHQALVQALNIRLSAVFEQSEDDIFVAATAWPAQHGHSGYAVHPQFVLDDGSAENDMAAAREREVRDVVRVLHEELEQARAAEQDGSKEYTIAVLVRSRGHLASVMPALRRAGIIYRAVELEPLAEQPEIVDMLALMRAMMHPADRMAWLSVLRAPWCGLLLGDLHTLAGGDDAALLKRSIPELLEQRIHLLTADGQRRAAHVRDTLAAAGAARYAGGNAQSFATWVERTWMQLGGHACLEATERENVEAMLRLLDEVAPNGIEVLRPDFALRLRRLCAAPDVRASERFGVQLMTIHKAKGLGFDAVLLPSLDRTTRSGAAEMLAMMQRTVRGPGQTLADELLLAPLSDTEGERDPLYSWVTAQKRRREQEELRRLLYVACTRARQRLHLFATLKVRDGAVQPPAAGSLAAAGWPGLREDFAGQMPAPGATHAIRLAAVAATEPLPSQLERLLDGWQPAAPFAPDIAWRPRSTRTPAALYERHETGGAARRARGTAMHAALEWIAEAGGSAQEETLRRIAARSLTAQGIAAEPMAGEIARYAIAAAAGESGRWALAPHPQAAQESAWQHWDAEGVLRTVRVDRSFLAGAQPGVWGDSHFWVLDYKTGAVPADFADGGALDVWLEEQKAFYRAQLETYGAILREARSADRPLRYALFFAELQRILWWA